MMMPLAGVAYAANWQSSVVVPTTVEYDSNPLLLTSKEKGVTRTIIAPDYNLIGQFDRDQLRLGLGMHLLRSSDRSVVDLSLIHISEPTRQCCTSRMPSSA